jgi:hypothetical protein
MEGAAERFVTMVNARRDAMATVGDAAGVVPGATVGNH